MSDKEKQPETTKEAEGGQQSNKQGRSVSYVGK
jgi:hypothetical protein